MSSSLVFGANLLASDLLQVAPAAKAGDATTIRARVIRVVRNMVNSLVVGCSRVSALADGNLTRGTQLTPVEVGLSLRHALSDPVRAHHHGRRGPDPPGARHGGAARPRAGAQTGARSARPHQSRDGRQARQPPRHTHA